MCELWRFVTQKRWRQRPSNYRQALSVQDFCVRHLIVYLWLKLHQRRCKGLDPYLSVLAVLVESVWFCNWHLVIQISSKSVDEWRLNMAAILFPPRTSSFDLFVLNIALCTWYWNLIEIGWLMVVWIWRRQPSCFGLALPVLNFLFWTLHCVYVFQVKSKSVE